MANRTLACAFLSGVLLACITGPLLAQTQYPPATTASAPVIRSTTHLVQINVIAQNKKGEPVEDLKQEDFTIFDQGQPQQVATFSSQTAAPRDRSTLAVLPPHVFSNRFEQTGQLPGSVTVILFDALNTSIQDQVYARQQVVKFLKQLQPQDHVAIYILTTEVKVLNEFTQDASTLLHAVEQFSGSFSHALDASTPETGHSSTLVADSPARDTLASRLKEFLDGASGQISDFAIINRATTTASAIEAIANHVGRIPGRKSLVWVSGSFPISIGYDAETLFQPAGEQREFGGEIERAARALNQANMAIYPVDARGLMAPPLYNAANSRGFNRRSPSAILKNLAPDQRNFDTMIVFADRTGGKAFYNTNDIEGAVQRALADGQFTYTLGFYPTHGKWDGKFHELKVHVAEKGLTLRYRKGYFALAERADKSSENEASLEAAVWSPVEWTNLDLQVTLNKFDPSSHTLSLQVAFDPHGLALVQKEARWQGKVYVLFVQLGKGNKSINREKETFDLNFKQDTYERLLKSGIKFSGPLVLSPETEALRVVAEDAESGAIGTLTIPIKKSLPAENLPTGNQPPPQNGEIYK